MRSGPYGGQKEDDSGTPQIMHYVCESIGNGIWNTLHVSNFVKPTFKAAGSAHVASHVEQEVMPLAPKRDVDSTITTQSGLPFALKLDTLWKLCIEDDVNELATIECVLLLTHKHKDETWAE